MKLTVPREQRAVREKTHVDGYVCSDVKIPLVGLCWSFKEAVAQ